MAAVQVDRRRVEGVVARVAFARLGVRHGDGRGSIITWKAPGRVTIGRADLDRVIPWARNQDMPSAWVRLADGARAAGSVVVEHTSTALVLDDPPA